MRLRPSSLLRPSIARRLLLSLLLASALVWAAIYLLGHGMVYAEETGSFDREMLALARSIDRLASAAAGDEARFAAALEGLDARIQSDTELLNYPVGFLGFQVRDAQGRRLAHGGTGPDALADGPDGYADQGGAQPHRVYRQHSADGRYRIEVTQSHDSRRLNFDSVMVSSEGLLQPLLVAFPLVLLPVWLSVHTGLRPLRELSRELAQRPPGHLQPLSVRAPHAELAPVVHELNATLARLRELLQRERNFLADAAHELRTPLAVIGAQRDVLQHSGSAPERQEAAERLGVGIERAGRLVGQLLTLARLDADMQHESVPVDLADIARDCLAAHAGPATARGMVLGYLGPDHLPTQGPLQVFESILDNLVGNAIRHGHPGGRVELQLDCQAGRMQLEVRDDGPGIAPPWREAVFERFVRAPGSGANGSGLGLAVVRSAARRIGATVDLSAGIGGQGTAFRVQWVPPQESPAPRNGR